MNLKNIWNEIETKIMPLFGMVSVITVVIQLQWGIFERVELTLLQVYIFCVIWYYLSYKVLPRFIPNMRGNNKIFNIVQIISVPIMWLIVDIIWDIITNESINFIVLAISAVIMFILLVIVYSIIYFFQVRHTKNLNIKLQEYKKMIDYDFPQSRIEMLREFADYNTDPKYCRNINYEYELGTIEKYQNIIKKFMLAQITDGRKDLDLILALCKWVSDTFGADGNSGYSLKRNAHAIIKHAQRNNGKINSHLRSLLLAELLRAYGIKAYHVLCLRFEEPHHNYNALVHAYSESLNKWIMLDPEFNIYLKDKNNDFISIPEFRNILINGEEFSINADAKHYWNGETITPKKYGEYMATYMFRFSRTEKNYYGSDIRHNNMPNKMLIPEKYLKYTENFSEHIKPNLLLSERSFWEL